MFYVGSFNFSFSFRSTKYVYKRQISNIETSRDDYEWWHAFPCCCTNIEDRWKILSKREKTRFAFTTKTTKTATGLSSSGRITNTNTTRVVDNSTTTCTRHDSQKETDGLGNDKNNSTIAQQSDDVRCQQQQTTEAEDAIKKEVEKNWMHCGSLVFVWIYERTRER